jgi:sulfite exporter TauE/SafE
LALLGLLLGLYGFVRNFPHWAWCGQAGRLLGPIRTAAVFGLLTGVNICPPFLVALLDAVRAGGVVQGAWVFSAFFVGTSLILLPAPLLGKLGQSPAWRAAGRVAAVLVGAWLMLQAWGIWRE